MLTVLKNCQGWDGTCLRPGILSVAGILQPVQPRFCVSFFRAALQWLFRVLAILLIQTLALYKSFTYLLTYVSPWFYQNSEIIL